MRKWSSGKRLRTVVLATLVLVSAMLVFIRLVIQGARFQSAQPTARHEPTSVSITMIRPTPTSVPTLDCSPYGIGTPFRTTPSPLEECERFNRAPDGNKLVITEEVVAYFTPPQYATRQSSPAYLQHIPTTSAVVLGWSAEIIYPVYYSDEARRQLEAVLNDPVLMALIRARIEELEAQLPTLTPAP